MRPVRMSDHRSPPDDWNVLYALMMVDAADDAVNVRRHLPHELLMFECGMIEKRALNLLKYSVYKGWLSYSGSIKCARLTEAGRFKLQDLRARLLG